MALNNYYKPTPKKWRMFGDFLLLMIPVATLTIANAPNLSDIEKYWWTAGCNFALVLGKFLTNTAKPATED